MYINQQNGFNISYSLITTISGIPKIEGKHPHMCTPVRIKTPPGTCNVRNGDKLCKKACEGGSITNGWLFGNCRGTAKERYCECRNCYCKPDPCP